MAADEADACGDGPAMSNGHGGNSSSGADSPAGGKPGLVRSLSLGHAVLYGLGVTIGAGIYVLVGPAIGRAGAWAPLAFIVAAALLSLTAASFAELGSRMPVAAGEAAYVRAGFRSDTLATITGLVVVAISIVSAAAISVGSAGYVAQLVGLPQGVIIATVVIAMGLIAIAGVRSSVTFAGVMTVIEIGGLLVIVAAGAMMSPLEAAPTATSTGGGLPAITIAGMLSTTLLAVFAFIGFEGLANIAEEVHEPHRNLPLAIFITLIVTTVLYVAVIWVCLRAAPQSELAASSAPLAIVFERTTGADPRIMTLIAIVATLNGIIVQIIMAARVLYGLAVQRSVPAILGRVNSVTHTPVVATVLTVACVLVLAIALPLGALADWTSRMILALFAFTNAALGVLKWREKEPPAGVFTVPAWVPWAGASVTTLVLIAEMSWSG